MFFDENLYCYLNGKIIKMKDAKISPFDLGFARGYAVTEVMRTYHGKIFLYDEHYTRLSTAVKFLRLKLKESKLEIQQVIEKLVLKNKCLNSKIKLVLSPGIGKSDLDLGDNETLFIFVQTYTDFPKKFYKDGIKIISAKYKRNLSEVKSSNYIEAIRLRKEMRAKKADEILYILNNYVLECSTSNIFMIKDDILITPKNDILYGTTRNFIVSFAKKSMKVIERDITFDELLEADEIFITATTKQIMPVVKIDDRVIRDGKVGENTLRLQQIFIKERDIRLKS
jgi:D-amino acid aminotransferase